MIIRNVILTTSTLALILSTGCKISDPKQTFCEAVNRKREECSDLQIRCDAVLATIKNDIVAKVKQCPVAPTSGEFILMPSFPEIGASPCCVKVAPSPQPK